MTRLRVLDILKEQGHTRYWLFKRMDMTSYHNFQCIIENQTSSIRFGILDKLSSALDVPVGELFEQVPDEDSDSK